MGIFVERMWGVAGVSVRMCGVAGVSMLVCMWGSAFEVVWDCFVNPGLCFHGPSVVPRGYRITSTTAGYLST